MITKGYYSFTHCGHNVELEQWSDGSEYGYGNSWFITIDTESTGLEPKALRRDAKASAIAYIARMQIYYQTTNPYSPRA